MVYTYAECINIYKTHYALTKALQRKEIFKIKDGIYSNVRYPKFIEIFVKEHKDAVFTLQSAFYYFNMSDVVPDKYCVATDKDSSKYKESNVVQYFMNGGTHTIGAISFQYSGAEIRIYNKERLLIELIRYKHKLPFDYYKEIIGYYRDHIDEINVSLIFEYLESFPKKDLIAKTIELEVL